MGRACEREGVGKNWRKVIWAERVTDRGWEKFEIGDMGRAFDRQGLGNLEKGDMCRACDRQGLGNLEKGDMGRACDRQGLGKI